jgi:hypothetical protein
LPAGECLHNEEERFLQKTNIALSVFINFECAHDETRIIAYLTVVSTRDTEFANELYFERTPFKDERKIMSKQETATRIDQPD